LIYDLAPIVRRAAIVIVLIILGIAGAVCWLAWD
jgi:hypothetical protein